MEKNNSKYKIKKIFNMLGYAASLVTIIGFAFAIYTYKVSIKPAIDLEKIKKETEELKEANKEYLRENEKLEDSIVILENDFVELRELKELLSTELDKTERLIKSNSKELITAHSDIYFTPIINEIIMNSVSFQQDENFDIKAFALDELNEELERNSLSNYQEESLKILIEFVEGNLESDSELKDSLEYIIYVSEYLNPEMNSTQ